MYQCTAAKKKDAHRFSDVEQERNPNNANTKFVTYIKRMRKYGKFLKYIVLDFQLNH